MSHVNPQTIHFYVTPPPAGKPYIERVISQPNTSEALFNMGLNMTVELSTASVYLKLKQDMPPDSTSTAAPELKTITVMALLDTGCRKTSIDAKLAEYLELEVTGSSNCSTANGFKNNPTYAIDIGFPGSPLKKFTDLDISSCNLAHFDLAKCLESPTDPRNFGLLIGRNILEKWHITWHGPTSSVFISD